MRCRAKWARPDCTERGDSPGAFFIANQNPLPTYASGGDRKSEIIRFITESWGKSSLGARLRTREVRGRDAALPAPLLAASLGLVGRGTVGALPQTPQGTLSLDPERGRRKGTKSPLDPFSRLSWSRFHPPSACSFLGLRLSPCLLPQLSVKNRFFAVTSRNGGLPS